MIEPLDNRDTNLPKAEQSSLLSSNMEVMDCSALGVNEQEPPTDILLDQLAAIIVEAYFYEKQHNKWGSKTRGDILQGIE